MRPEKLVLRCFAYRTPENTWVAKCIDLSLAVEAESREEVKKSLEDNILVYIETVLDTEDTVSVTSLLLRKGPLLDRIQYHIFRFLVAAHMIKDRFVFKEPVPIHLGATCNG